MQIYGHLFAHLPSEEPAGRPRFFVEAGAADGRAESDTFALERCFGWSGLLVEPDPRSIQELRRNRPNSEVREGCLAAREETRLLQLGEDPLHSSTWPSTKGTGHGELQLECRPLSAHLEELQVSVVDFLALDTEGTELEVLDGIDWAHGPPIDILSIDIAMPGTGLDAGRARELRDYLNYRGYEFLWRLGSVDVYRRLTRLGSSLSASIPGGDCSGGPLIRTAVTPDIAWPDFQIILQRLLQALEEDQVANAMDLTLVRAVANSDPIEAYCPLAALAMRLIGALADEGLETAAMDRLESETGRVESALALAVYRHEVLFTDAQSERLWAAGPPQEPEAARWRHRLPVPRLFLTDMDLRLTVQSRWHVLEALDLLSRRIRHRVPVILGLDSAGVCGIEADEQIGDAGLMERYEECGFVVLAHAQVAQAHGACLDQDFRLARKVLLNLDVGLKAIARRRGFYWLLHRTGGEDPTIWRQLALLGAELREKGLAL